MNQNQRSKLGWALTLSTTLGCTTTHRAPTSNVLVANGLVAAAGQFPAVVRLDIPPSSTSPNGGICTGTFLNSSVLLTAEHCVFNVSSASVSGVTSTNIFLATPSANFASLEAAVAASQTAGDDGTAAATAEMNQAATDQALVIFPVGTAGRLGITQFPQIDPSPDATNQPVIVVGFGESVASDPASAGVKRYGRNTVAQTDSGVIMIQGNPSATPGVNSRTLEGDSGGPLLSDTAVQTIFGTVSQGSEGSGPGVALYASSQTPAAQQLYATAISQGAQPFFYHAASSTNTGTGTTGSQACLTLADSAELGILFYGKGAGLSLSPADLARLQVLTNEVRNGVCQNQSTQPQDNGTSTTCLTLAEGVALSKDLQVQASGQALTAQQSQEVTVWATRYDQYKVCQNSGTQVTGGPSVQGLTALFSGGMDPTLVPNTYQTDVTVNQISEGFIVQFTTPTGAPCDHGAVTRVDAYGQGGVLLPIVRKDATNWDFGGANSFVAAVRVFTAIGAPTGQTCTLAVY